VVAKEKGAPKREVLMKRVQDHPRASVSLDASRAHHHGQGLEEHHQRTTAAPTWSVYDTMHHSERGRAMAHAHPLKQAPSAFVPEHKPHPRHWEKRVLYAFLRLMGATQKDAGSAVGRAKRTVQEWEEDKGTFAQARDEARQRSWVMPPA